MSQMRQPCFTSLIAALALLAAACGKSGNAHSTLAGVYTPAQAARGKDVYGGMCMSCHAGMGNHVGPVFRARWGGYDLQELNRYVSVNMPKNDPGSLAADDYVAVIAYLLQLNGMPAGASPLPVDTTALKAIIYDTASAKP